MHLLQLVLRARVAARPAPQGRGVSVSAASGGACEAGRRSGGGNRSGQC
nr:hypothetical protein RVX_2455 [Nitratidesulfovibrio sp. HK-II]